MKLTRKNAEFVSRRVGDRVLLGLIAIPLLAFSLWGLVLRFTSAASPRNIKDALAQIAVGEFLTALLLVSSFSLVWSVATPESFERLLRKHAVRLGLATIVFVIVLFIVVWWL